MKFLLDTHTVVRSWLDNPRLSANGERRRTWTAGLTQRIGNDPDGGYVSPRPTCLSQPVYHVRMITRPHPRDAVAHINIERTWRSRR